MKVSEFGWYSSPTRAGTDQLLRRGGRGGTLFALVDRAVTGWVATVHLHLDEARHEQLACDSELEAMLAAHSRLEDLIATGNA